MADQIPLSFATCSINAANLPDKLTALSKAGFNAVELSFPDLVSHASEIRGHDIAPDNYAALITAASEVGKLCDAHGLKIMMLQPFSNFEGWPRGSEEREDAFRRAKAWIEIMRVVGTDMLQVGSTDTPRDKLSTSREDIITDLRELCDLLSADGKGMRLAYENWCWSSHAPTWKSAWEVVRDVDRPNIGLCLDTFQTAGSEWADPTTSSGRLGNVQPGSSEEADLNRRFGESMRELSGTVPKEKIYLLQVSDAYLPRTGPLGAGVVDGVAARARWSHDFRPMPYDGGFLPVEEVGRAVLRTGFRGWFSMEIFDGGKDGKGREYEVGEFAGRAMERMRRFIGNCL